VAGPDVRNACKRHLDDLVNSGARGFAWNIEAAMWAIGFFLDVLRLNGGEFEGEPFHLLGWQAFIVGSLFGWLRDDGTAPLQRARTPEEIADAIVFVASDKAEFYDRRSSSSQRRTNCCIKLTCRPPHASRGCITLLARVRRSPGRTIQTIALDRPLTRKLKIPIVGRLQPVATDWFSRGQRIMLGEGPSPAERRVGIIVVS
jgi:hypothetical protein